MVRPLETLLRFDMKRLHTGSTMLRAFVERTQMQIYHSADLNGSSFQIMPTKAIDDMLERSASLLGERANEFIVLSNSMPPDSSPMHELVEGIENNRLHDTAVVVPYNDGGLIVVSERRSDWELQSSDAEWWYPSKPA